MIFYIGKNNAGKIFQVMLYFLNKKNEEFEKITLKVIGIL